MSTTTTTKNKKSFVYEIEYNKNNEPKIPLILGYWDIRGLAESIRLILQYHQVHYIDRLYVQADAPSYEKDIWYNEKKQKSNIFKNLPYLQFKQQQEEIIQSVAIIHYLCDKYQFYGRKKSCKYDDY